MKWKTLIVVLAVGFIVSVGSAHSQDYVSPYKVAFSIPEDQLLAPNAVAPRNSPRHESITPFDQWYTPRIRRKFGAWGPEPRHYPAIDNFDTLSPTFKRERLLAVAMQLVGLPYQHHHIPDWDPPADWPWKPVAYGRNSKGIDCSDFTSWLYNYGLGIKLRTGIQTQANMTSVPGPGDDGFIEARAISANSYGELVKKLKTGDLLYITNKAGNVSHVIMWVGECGRAPDSVPLVIDCTGLGHKDSNGVEIPIGVHLRPFLSDGWYYKNFSHAHRIIRENNDQAVSQMLLNNGN